MEKPPLNSTFEILPRQKVSIVGKLHPLDLPATESITTSSSSLSSMADSGGSGSGSGSGDDDDNSLANFLESEILLGEQETEAEVRPSKKPRVDERIPLKTSNSGVFSKVPPELVHNIFKFLSSEDLVSCSLVCWFMNFAASDECLWRRLYCMRWGLSSGTVKFRACAWKKLYIQRDQEDMVEFVKNTPSEFKEYYIQMQAAKRSQAPLPSQVNDDQVLLDRTVADQVSIWKSSRGLTEESLIGHVCSGKTCSYTQIGDVFLCDRTGHVHVCDDACRELVLDQVSGLLVCTISGHCFDRWLSPEEESSISDTEQQQGGVTDEAEPFMGSGRFVRAYLLGYNCANEQELEAALRSS